MAEAALDEYSYFDNLFHDVNKKYLNEDKKFISQSVMPGYMIIWIHGRNW